MTKQFAATPEQHSAIARLGGQAAHRVGRAHEFTTAEAIEAGRLGGLKSGITRTNNSIKALGGNSEDFDSPEQMRIAAKKFRQQRSRASQRGIEFLLTFAEWWAIWRQSGQWDSRGRSKAESSVMARYGDVGPYSTSNVYITTLAKNFKEAWVSSPDRMAHRRAASQSLTD